jgi:hypothetical protein
VPGVNDLAAGGTLVPFAGGPLCWLFASSACADTANAASSDTNGTTILDRVDTLILEKPPFGRAAGTDRPCRSIETLKAHFRVEG